ncbi:uncharacterized protein FFNC_15566 [Fusarium fujikuroi]|nr:uncharacterized protein FFNC_15566 [Fusarium fujikuroi]
MADSQPSSSQNPNRARNYSTPVLPVSSCISTDHGEELRSEAAGDTIVQNRLQTNPAAYASIHLYLPSILFSPYIKIRIVERQSRTTEDKDHTAHT